MPESIPTEEFAARYSRHHLDLLRYVMSLVPNRTQAEDIVQETARRLWQKAEEYDPERPFWPWARQFAYFEVLKHRKKYAIGRKYFADELVENLAVEREEMEPELEARREALSYCLKKLDGRSRDLLNERYVHECSLKELAAAQGRSPNSLYLMMHRIRKQLQQCVTRRVSLENRFSS